MTQRFNWNTSWNCHREDCKLRRLAYHWGTTVAPHSADCDIVALLLIADPLGDSLAGDTWIHFCNGYFTYYCTKEKYFVKCNRGNYFIWLCIYSVWPLEFKILNIHLSTKRPTCSLIKGKPCNILFRMLPVRIGSCLIAKHRARGCRKENISCENNKMALLQLQENSVNLIVTSIKCV